MRRLEVRGRAGQTAPTAVALLLVLLCTPALALPSGAGTPEPESATPALPSIPFTDVTEAAGIGFVHRNGATGKKYLPETMGGGAAFLDHDEDGDPDLLLLHSDAAADPPVVLYANDGAGRFTDVTAKVGLTEAVPKGLLGMGVAAADLDGDGWTDLFLTGVGRDRLLWNREGRFVDGTAAAGVGGPEDGWSTGAAFFDAEGDGDLDLFVVRYVEWSRKLDDERDFQLDGIGRAFGLPQDYRGTHPALFLNRGDGTFRDASAEAGIQVHAGRHGAPASTGPDGKGESEPLGKGLAVAVVDVDRDGLPDLFVANDTTRNFLFHNQGGGRFEEVGELFGVAYSPDGQATGAMGVDFADLLGDGRLAYAVGNFSREVTSLYRAGDDPTFFEDEALAAGLAAGTRMALTFGVLLFDADLDGRLDLLQANGHVEPDVAKADPGQSYRQPAQLFWNAGPGSGSPAADRPRFRGLPAESVGDLARPLAGRGAAYADVDGDGDLDVLLTQIAGPARLLRNDQSTGHHWLRLDLEGRAPNRDAVGAHVELTAAGRTHHRHLQPARGYLTHVEPTLTFGLGGAEKIDLLRVTWPDGIVQELSGEALEALPVDRRHRLTAPEAPAAPEPGMAGGG